jgi:hypothetical protein
MVMSDLSHAPQHRSNASHQFARPEGLGQVVVGPKLQAQHLVVVFHPSREQDDGGFLLLAVQAHEIVPIHLRHHDVQHDEVGLLLPCQE